MNLKEVKEYLKITWDDEDVKLNSLIKRGEDYLQSIAGVTLDFESETATKSLLLDHIRYAYNNALEYFEENFRSDLIRLQFKSVVNLYESKD